MCSTAEERQERALTQYKKVLSGAGGVERLASGSDDFTLFLWEPSRDKKPAGEFQ